MDKSAADAVTVRPLLECELAEADRVFRLAFGTFLGLPDPTSFAAGTNSVRTRWKADPAAALAALAGERLVGSNLIAAWGSFGVFGPLTVHPEFWNAGVATRLLGPTMDLFERRGVRHAGLFTHPESLLHVHLYEKFDFWAQFLTAIMAKEVGAAKKAAAYALWSELAEGARQESLRRCREVTETVLEGLDLAPEIRSVAAQNLGDTLLLEGGTRLEGFGICHCGPDTEAGPGTCYVKFGAVRSGAGATERFERLLDACEGFAAARGLARLVAGANMGRLEAYRAMVGRGFRTSIQGVAMTRHAETLYNRPEAFVIDDWR